MLVFILLTMMMGGVVLLSASLFYLNSSQTSTVQAMNANQQRTGGVIFDDTEIQGLAEKSAAEPNPVKSSPALLEFTRTSRTTSKQLPLLGMPDKAFYHIH